MKCGLEEEEKCETQNKMICKDDVVQRCETEMVPECHDEVNEICSTSPSCHTTYERVCSTSTQTICPYDPPPSPEPETDEIKKEKDDSSKSRGKRDVIFKFLKKLVGKKVGCKDVAKEHCINVPVERKWSFLR